MFERTPEQLAALREVGAYEHLPFLPVYVSRRDTPDHFSAECIDGTLTQKHYLEVGDLSDCPNCVKSPQMKIVKALEIPMEALDDALFSLQICKANLTHLNKDEIFDVPFLGGILLTLTTHLPLLLGGVAKYEDLAPVVQKLEKVAEEESNILFSFLQSYEGKRAALKYVLAFRSGLVRGHSGPVQESNVLFNHDALLFTVFPQDNAATAVAASYGVEVAPHKFLVRDEPKIMAYLKVFTVASPLNLSADCSAEVIATMAALWEPGSADALGDAQKAFNAALELTPSS